MNSSSSWDTPRGVLVACLVAAVAACAPARTAGGGASAPDALPLLAAPQITLNGPQPGASPAADPLAGISTLETVTLRAQDVDVRALLTALAEAAEVSLVLDPGVDGRMSVNLVDVPVVDALREVLAAANLSVVAPPPTAPWAPVVFYALPVDMDRASAALIQAHFGVSEHVARWIVEQREP